MQRSRTIRSGLGDSEEAFGGIYEIEYHGRREIDDDAGQISRPMGSPSARQLRQRIPGSRFDRGKDLRGCEEIKDSRVKAHSPISCHPRPTMWLQRLKGGSMGPRCQLTFTKDASSLFISNACRAGPFRAWDSWTDSHATISESLTPDEKLTDFRSILCFLEPQSRNDAPESFSQRKGIAYFYADGGKQRAQDHVPIHDVLSIAP